MNFPLTKQQMFDAAYTGVVKQGVRCVNEHGACVYMGPNNQRCAASHVFAISNPEYDLEELSVEDSAMTAMAAMGYKDVSAAQFMQKLQHIHDSAGTYEEFDSEIRQDLPGVNFVEAYKQAMAVYAEEKELNIPQVA